MKQNSEYRFVKVLYDKDILEVVKEVEDSQQKVDILITTLPKQKQKNEDELGRLGVTNLLLNKIDLKRESNVLSRFYNLCANDSFIYIFSTNKQLQEDLISMTNVGFSFVRSLIYKIKPESGVDYYWKNTINYILMFRKGFTGRGIRNTRLTNLLLEKDIMTPFYSSKDGKIVDYPLAIIELLIKQSRKKASEKTLVFNPYAFSGSVPVVCLKENIHYIGNISGKCKRTIEHQLNLVLSKIEDNIKKKEIKEFKKDLKTEAENFVSEKELNRRKNISENMRKKSPENKKNKLKQKLALVKRKTTNMLKIAKQRKEEKEKDV